MPRLIRKLIHRLHATLADARNHPNTGYTQIPDRRHGHKGETTLIKRHGT